MIPFIAMLAASARASLPPMAPCRPTDAHARPVYPDAPPRAPDEDRGLRDSFGEFEHTVTSEHFAVKWGSSGEVAESEALSLLDGFETAWAVYIEDWGMPAPEGTDDYLFNVYIGNTGSPSPDISGAYGYYTVDNSGWPYIVITPEVLGVEEAGAGVVAHEFQHAVQDATGRYWGYTQGWVREAGATWASAEVYPDSPYPPAYLFAYITQPQTPLEFFDYTSSGLDALHPYGAFIWLRYLQEYSGDPDIVVRSWLDDSLDSDPLTALGELLDELGLDLMDEFSHFAARNVLLDYERRDLYEEIVNGPNSNLSQSITASLDATGAQGWQHPSDLSLPGAWAYNIIQVETPEAGDFQVGFHGEAEGSAGSDAEWRAWLVSDVDGQPQYTQLHLEDETIETTWTATGTEDAVYLVLAVGSTRLLSDETFGYTYMFQGRPDDRITPTGTADPASVEPRGGCATPHRGTTRGLWLGLLGLAGLALRRRHT